MAVAGDGKVVCFPGGAEVSTRPVICSRCFRRHLSKEDISNTSAQSRFRGFFPVHHEELYCCTIWQVLCCSEKSESKVSRKSGSKLNDKTSSFKDPLEDASERIKIGTSIDCLIEVAIPIKDITNSFKSLNVRKINVSNLKNTYQFTM